MNNSTVPENNVFDIKEKLATGSFGSTIFKAYNAAVGQVAIAKKYPAAVTNDYEEFMKILDAVKSTNSNHIVGIFGYYKATKYFWVVMEFCLGYSVWNLMERLCRPLKESHIKTVLSHALKGIEALHARNIIHTRIKARNLLLTTYGVCKLAEPSPHVNIADMEVNVDGIVGNSYWTAPEVLLEQGYATASDIWSLGITLIEMAERHPPYAETHPSRVMVTIPARPPPQLLNPDAWSKPLKVLLAACLQKNPDNRQTAANLLTHKIIKKADYKGMQTIVQKCMKLQQQGARFYNNDTIPKPKPGRDSVVEEIPLDEGVWADSGTIVWTPSQPTDSTAGSSASSSQPPQPRRASSLSSPKRTDPLRPKPEPIKQSKSSPASARTEKSPNNKPNKPPPIQPEIISQAREIDPGNRADEAANNFAECDSDTMKPGAFAKMKRSMAEPDPSENDTNLPSPGPVKAVPRLSKASESVQSEPNKKETTPSSPATLSPEKNKLKRNSVSNNKRKKEPSPSRYQDQTVTLKMVEDYTPSYMDFYKDSTPPLIHDKEEEPAVPPTGGLSRRNSIDERGIKQDQMQEELQKNLNKIDGEYCSNLEQVKLRYIAVYEALRERIEQLQGGKSAQAPGKHCPDMYGKLRKLELVLMLRFVETRHEEVQKEAKEHFDLQHRFLMDAMRNTDDRDEEIRYKLSISENNEDQANTLASINIEAQIEREEILRAIERIDYASAIAVE